MNREGSGGARGAWRSEGRGARVGRPGFAWNSGLFWRIVRGQRRVSSPAPMRGDGNAMDRKTNQRAAIRDAIGDAARPLSPNEILDAAKERVPRLGIATVYRTVKVLLEEGWLKAVTLPGEPPRYELAHIEHHHHFHCRACGRVFDIEGCPGDLRALAPRGYRVESHEVVLYGQCLACAAKSPAKKTRKADDEHAHAHDGHKH